MKTLISLVLVVSALLCKAQSQIGMSNVYSFTPTFSVTYGTSVILKVYAKNKSNTLFAGQINVFAKVNVPSGISLGMDSTIVSSNTPLNSGDSLPFNITFTPQPGPGAFNIVNCCINPIVVWPIMSNGDLGLDTLNCGLQIIDSNVGLKEFTAQSFLVYPNPVKDILIIETINGSKSKNIIIYDALGQILQIIEYRERIDISTLSAGCYWITINTSDGKIARQLLLKE